MSAVSDPPSPSSALVLPPGPQMALLIMLFNWPILFGIFHYGSPGGAVLLGLVCRDNELRPATCEGHGANITKGTVGAHSGNISKDLI